MNLLAINNFNFTPLKNRENKTQTTSFPKFGLTMAKPLSKDTVSFNKTNTSHNISFMALDNKTMKTIKAGITQKDAIEIFNDIHHYKDGYLAFLKKLMAPLIVSETNPDGIILDIKGRTKSPDSIREKAATDGLKTKKEVKMYMTDLTGCKIIMKDGSQKAVEKILNYIFKAVDMGALIPLEIDNKRPGTARGLTDENAEQWDYVNSKFLDKYAQKLAKSSNRELFINPDGEKSLDTAELLKNNILHFLPYDHTKANYMALHMLLKFPNGNPFELQILGVDLNVFKDLDDKLYKILNNKNVPDKYNDLVTLIKPLIVKKEDKEEFKEYVELRNLIERLEKDNKNIKRKINRTSIDKKAKDKLVAQKEENEAKLIETKNILKENVERIKELEEKIRVSDAFGKYRGEVFLSQREKEPTPCNTVSEFFLPLRYNIPYQNLISEEYYKYLVETYEIVGNPYDVNNLYKIYKICHANEIKNIK